MLKIFESYWIEKKLRAKIEQLEQENYNQRNTISALLNEIKRRDQTISTLSQQKEIRNPDPFNFDFPGTEKSFDDFWAKFAGPKNKES